MCIVETELFARTYDSVDLRSVMIKRVMETTCRPRMGGG